MKSSELLPNIQSLNTETIRRFWDSMNSDHRLKRHGKMDQEETGIPGIAFSGLGLVAFTSLFPVTRCFLFFWPRTREGFGMFMDFQLKQIE